jgi:hypothetical protein
LISILFIFDFFDFLAAISRCAPRVSAYAMFSPREPRGARAQHLRPMIYIDTPRYAFRCHFDAIDTAAIFASRHAAITIFLRLFRHFATFRHYCHYAILSLFLHFAAADTLMPLSTPPLRRRH